MLAKVTTTSTLPFEDKFDELVIAGVMEYLVKFLDRNNTAVTQAAKQDVFDLKHVLITGASKNAGLNLQSARRREEIPYFSPRKVIS